VGFGEPKPAEAGLCIEDIVASAFADKSLWTVRGANQRTLVTMARWRPTDRGEMLVRDLQRRRVEWIAALCGHGLGPLLHGARNAPLPIAGGNP